MLKSTSQGLKQIMYNLWGSTHHKHLFQKNVQTYFSFKPHDFIDANILYSINISLTYKPFGLDFDGNSITVTLALQVAARAESTSKSGRHTTNSFTP